ncbi:MAG: helix-turn-helix transcriptional regulator [Magnetococcales bacterium]|nr:helix-turn-helix transcriptional regulator [Magnetococcales bacterium]
MEDSLFGRRLKQARKRVGITQRGLGVKMSLPPNKASVYVNRWELGTRSPRYDDIQKMAKVLGVSPAFFFLGPEEDALAEIILLLGSASGEKLDEILDSLKKSI